MFFIFPSGPSASFANCQLTSVDFWQLAPIVQYYPTNNCLSQHTPVLVFRLPPLPLPPPPPPPPPPPLLPPQPLHPPCCLHRRCHYPQRHRHPHHPQPLFEATLSSLCPPWLSLLPTPLQSTRRRRCHPKPSSAATVSRRCQSSLPPPPLTFSTVPNRRFSQSPLRQCIICRFWYITKNR